MKRLTGGQSISALTKPQKRMLIAAANRHGRITRGGEEGHFTYVGRGQAQTAKSLEAMGLGGYTWDTGATSSKFWIWDRGYALARELFPDDVKPSVAALPTTPKEKR